MQSKCGFCDTALTSGGLVELLRPIVRAPGESLNLDPAVAVLSCPSCKAVLGTTVLLK